MLNVYCFFGVLNNLIFFFEVVIFFIILIRNVRFREIELGYSCEKKVE